MAIELTRQVTGTAENKAVIARSAEKLSRVANLTDAERTADSASLTADNLDNEARNDNIIAPSEVNEVDRESVQETVNNLNTAAQKMQRNLEFSVDDNSGKTVITVRDRETEEVVRQIPSDEVLQIAQKVEDLRNTLEGVSGLLISTEA